MGKLDEMLKASGDITESKAQNNLNEAEANNQANVQADTEAANANPVSMTDEEKAKAALLEEQRVANIKEGEARKAAKLEADKIKYQSEHYNVDALKEKEAQLKEAHASVDDPLVETTLQFNFGRHRVTVIPQKGTTYNYYAECSCAWQGRFLTQEMAEVTCKQHVYRRRSSAP